MSTAAATIAPATKPAMSRFERYRTAWVAACIVLGIAAGAAVPGLFARIAAAEVAKVNLPVAVLIWLMITMMPSLCRGTR